MSDFCWTSFQPARFARIDRRMTMFEHHVVVPLVLGHAMRLSKAEDANVVCEKGVDHVEVAHRTFRMFVELSNEMRFRISNFSDVQQKYMAVCFWLSGCQARKERGAPI